MTSATYHHSHTGVCVSDLDRSLRFYCEGLGFTRGQAFHLTRQIAEVDPPVDVTAQFIHLGELTVELLSFASPGTFGEASTRRNKIGLTHLSFVVDDPDIDTRVQELEALGGTVLHDTRHGAGVEGSEQLIFVADPDGTRVEVMFIPEGHPYWEAKAKARAGA